MVRVIRESCCTSNCTIFVDRTVEYEPIGIKLHDPDSTSPTGSASLKGGDTIGIYALTPVIKSVKYLMLKLDRLCRMREKIACPLSIGC